MPALFALSVKVIGNPQIAAFALRHLVVEKEVSRGRTRTRVTAHPLRGGG